MKSALIEDRVTYKIMFMIQYVNTQVLICCVEEDPDTTEHMRQSTGIYYPDETCNFKFQSIKNKLEDMWSWT